MKVSKKVQFEQTTLQKKLNAHVLSFVPRAEHISYKKISKEGLFQLKKIIILPDVLNSHILFFLEHARGFSLSANFKIRFV
ncbi:hypothetical protein N9N03_02885 [Chlamydiia bacterium]|nr:hypothetical protein [Chlamydiia bacterium]